MSGKDLEKELLWEAPHIAKEAPEQRAEADAFCEGYKKFLDASKTERECVKASVAMLKEAGYTEFDRTKTYGPGDKIFWNNRGKALAAATIGTLPLEEGLRLNAAHIDSPRLDLKPNPLFEKNEIAYLKPHYYGGIRKYQWSAVPLAMHGVVVKADGEAVTVSIGEEPGDPQFCITDLLPHLSAEQNGRKLGEGIKGEELNIVVGSIPFIGEEDEKIKAPVKLMAMKLLHEKYGIVEEDLISAELCAVPAYRATDIGLDRSMIGAYGQDDRVCAYAALRAILDIDRPKKTAVCLLVDKEEIGSMGVSGMQSAAFDTFIADLCASCGGVDREICYERSFCLSADVTAAYDPNFSEAYEKRNSARLNYGVGLCKYTGARGKSGASDASAEVVARARRMLDDAGALWQMAELGKVDYGGGGTIAQYMANRNIDTLDAGVPVLAMHAPFETVSKLDCYMTYKAMRALYEEQ